jgi:predicted RNA-binding Zn ribbon-like protein
MVGGKKHSGNLTLLGGKLCLDFINTLDWRGRKPPVEYLNNFSDVIRWAAYVKIITPEQEIKMNRQSTKNKDLSKKALKSSIELRELLHRLFSDIEQRKKIKKQLLLKLNIFLQKASTGLTIKHPKIGFELAACVDPKNFMSLLYPIIWESVNLLTSNDRLRIKSCGDKTCGWVFLDTSKNKSRQWCDMKSCGNRAKARKFYKQKKG